MNMHPRQSQFRSSGRLALWNLLLGVVLALLGIILSSLQHYEVEMHAYLYVAPIPLGIYATWAILVGALTLFKRGDLAQRVSAIMAVCFFVSLGYALLELERGRLAEGAARSFIWNYPN